MKSWLRISFSRAPSLHPFSVKQTPVTFLESLQVLMKVITFYFHLCVDMNKCSFAVYLEGLLRGPPTLNDKNVIITMII